MTKRTLVIIAILGSLIGYCIVDLWVISMPFWKFFIIEFIITLLHELYNQAKQQVIINP
jgi:preprotein translocase subunit Sss1